MRIEKILVPVDFSKQSAEALRFAADLARRYDAALEVMHSFNSPTYAMPEGFVVPTQEQFALVVKELEGQLASVKKDVLAAGGLKVETKLVQGYPTSEILRAARDGKVDLIVMGTHGRTAMKHMLIGSVAENVVRLAECPVLTVRMPT